MKAHKLQSMLNEVNTNPWALQKLYRFTNEPRHDKSCLREFLTRPDQGVSDQARHKPACAATEAS